MPTSKCPFPSVCRPAGLFDTLLMAVCRLASMLAMLVLLLTLQAAPPCRCHPGGGGAGGSGRSLQVSVEPNSTQISRPLDPLVDPVVYDIPLEKPPLVGELLNTNCSACLVATALPPAGRQAYLYTALKRLPPACVCRGAGAHGSGVGA